MNVKQDNSSFIKHDFGRFPSEPPYYDRVGVRDRISEWIKSHGFPPSRLALIAGGAKTGKSKTLILLEDVVLDTVPNTRVAKISGEQVARVSLSSVLYTVILALQDVCELPPQSDVNNTINQHVINYVNSFQKAKGSTVSLLLVVDEFHLLLMSLPTDEDRRLLLVLIKQLLLMNVRIALSSSGLLFVLLMFSQLQPNVFDLQDHITSIELPETIGREAAIEFMGFLPKPIDKKLVSVRFLTTMT